MDNQVVTENTPKEKKKYKRKPLDFSKQEASRKAKLDEERQFVKSNPIGRLDRKALKIAQTGRPRKFTQTRMRNEINKYLQWCEDNDRVPSIKGLMIHLKMHKSQFYQYCEYPEFTDMMEQTRLIISEWCENEVWHSKGAASGMIAYMKNVHDWTEKVEQETTRVITVDEAKARLEMLLPKLLQQLKQQSIAQTIEIEQDTIEVVENVN